MYSLSDYDYILPDNLIAQELASPPDGCKLLVYRKKNNALQDTIFTSLPDLLEKDSLIVFNTSKVLKARLSFDDHPTRQGQEIFFLKAIDTYTFDALVRPGKKFKPGTVIQYDPDTTFTVESISEDGRIIRCNRPIFDVLQQHGAMPLPPYISYDKSKESSYQPVFAEQLGSVAAPTASLHFTDAILESLLEKGIDRADAILHVGLGTFKQVNVEDITTYEIHSETIEVTHDLFKSIAYKKLSNKHVIGVGTTVTRTLETLPYVWKLFSENDKSLFDDQTKGWRDSITHEITTEQSHTYVKNWQQSSLGGFTIESTLYIYPGFSFRVIAGLVTNFHLPKSSLLMLVAGFIGYEEMKNIYKHAITMEYKFYSFGDAMVLFP